MEVVTATISLDSVRAYRSQSSAGLQSSEVAVYPRVLLEFTLANPTSEFDLDTAPSPRIEPRFHLPEEEIALSGACWLWDYLRRSQQAGFLIPLSGGLDSASTATLVYVGFRQRSGHQNPR